jgi:hypothetical protein
MAEQNLSGQPQDNGYSIDRIYLLMGKMYADLYHNQEFIQQLRNMLQEQDKVIADLKLKEGLQIQRIESLLSERAKMNKEDGCCGKCTKDDINNEDQSTSEPRTETTQ